MLPMVVHAQETDVVDYVSDDMGGRTSAEVWTEVGITKVLPYNFSLGLDMGFRTDDWFNESSRFDIGVGLSWKPLKHWKFGVGYTFLLKHYFSETERKHESEREYKYKVLGTENDMTPDPVSFLGAPVYDDSDGTRYVYNGYNDSEKDFVRVTDNYWRPKHRFSFDAAYTNKYYGFLRLTLRERYQLTFVPSKDVDRTRTRTKTVRKYRDPRYPNGDVLNTYEPLESYQLYTDFWQEGNAIYSKDFYDDNEDYIYDPYPVQDVTATYLAEHQGEGLNTVTEQVKTKSSKTQHVLRSRLTLEIDKKGWQWTPYVYFELFNNMGEGWHFDKVRASAGVEYAVTKQHKISLGYVFNHENDDDGDMNIHAVNVGYKFKF